MLRLKGAEGIARVFFCTLVGKRIVMLHSFVKKSARTPVRERELAETRMKEINEAYDMIMNERRNPAGGSSGQQQSYGGAYNGQQYGGYQQRTYTGANAALYSQVRQAINQGNLGMAEALLQRAAGRDAEWFYLTGTVYYRKGWYDEAARAYTQACQMDPNNAEYQHALQNLHLSGGYGGYGGYRPMQETSMCDCCVQTLICNCCLNMCCGGGGC